MKIIRNKNKCPHNPTAASCPLNEQYKHEAKLNAASEQSVCQQRLNKEFVFV